MEKEETKCKTGNHHFGPTVSEWYEKCYRCPVLRKKKSIRVKAVK